MFLLLLAALGVTACTPKAAAPTGQAALPNVTSVAFNEKVSLRPGETVMVEGQVGRLTFVEVVNDSRCPEGVDCIRAGEAVVAVELASGNQQEVAIAADFRTAQRIVTGDIVINILGLTPYPREGSASTPEDYRLQVQTNAPRD